MTIHEVFEQWLAYAERDLDAAGVMCDAGRWYYVVYMCQQSVEKLVKGLYALYVDENVPRVHNIKTLFDCFEDRLTVPVPAQYPQLFKRLSAHYVSDRYPDFSFKAGEQIGEEEAVGVYKETKEVFAWLLTLKL